MVNADLEHVEGALAKWIREMRVEHRELVHVLVGARLLGDPVHVRWRRRPVIGHLDELAGVSDVPTTVFSVVWLAVKFRTATIFSHREREQVLKENSKSK